MDKLSKEQRSRNMKRIKSKGSKIETLLGKALWKKGVRYRKNDKSVYGKPDFTIKKYKIAIFCDSEFWHGKDWVDKKHEIKSNVDFWHKKIERNIARDKEVNEFLQNNNWTVIRFWGKEIIKGTEKCVLTVERYINDRESKRNQDY